MVVQGASVKMFDPAGRSVWELEFSKGIVGLSVNDRYLVCGSSALVVFERLQDSRARAAVQFPSRLGLLPST